MTEGQRGRERGRLEVLRSISLGEGYSCRFTVDICRLSYWTWIHYPNERKGESGSFIQSRHYLVLLLLDPALGETPNCRESLLLPGRQLRVQTADI